MNPRMTIYSLNIKDVQNVAKEQLGRKLSSAEIELVKHAIADKIKWYDVIAEAINENIHIVSAR